MTPAGGDGGGHFDGEFGRQYETLAVRSIPAYDALFQMAKGLLEEAVGENANMLIVGAGGGKEIATFGANSGWRFTGVDPSAQMLAFAQAKADQQGISDRVHLQVGYAADLPLEPLYDAATCILVLHFVPNDGAKLALLKDIAARLKIGAPLVLASVFGDEESLGRARPVWRRFQRDNGRTVEDIESTSAALRHSNYPTTEARLLELLREAGFTDIYHFYTALWFGGWVMRKK